MFPSKDISKLQVKFMHTVLDVKKIVEILADFPVENWDFIHSGIRLENFRSLAYYDIKEDAILKMVPPEYQIFLKTWNRKTIIVYVNQSDTIADVKIKISEKIDTPYTYMYLTYGGKPL